MGVIPGKASAEKAHCLLEDLLPERTYYPFHLNMIRHGRTLCSASDPQCGRCPLATICDYAQEHDRSAQADDEGQG